MNSMNPLVAGLPPVHPGAILREDILPSIDKPKTEIARMLRIGRQSLYDILDERQGVTAPMALRFAKLFGNSAEFWLTLQQTFDLKMAERTMADELASIPTLEVAT